jgi:hypothetical protein
MSGIGKKFDRKIPFFYFRRPARQFWRRHTKGVLIPERGQHLQLLKVHSPPLLFKKEKNVFHHRKAKEDFPPIDRFAEKLKGIPPIPRANTRK